MATSPPYQPSLLRFTHILTAGLGILALITGWAVYNRYDGRVVRLPLPPIDDLIDVHGTVGLGFLIVLPLLVGYSFHLGAHRLPPRRGARASQGNRPAVWRLYHSFTNLGLLGAATLAVVSGRHMQENWLPAGQLNHGWYWVHLGAWALLLALLVLHVCIGLMLGGRPLLASMLAVRVRAEDTPRAWLGQVRAGFQQAKSLPPHLRRWEALIGLGLVAAWLGPLVSVVFPAAGPGNAGRG
ncbi:MAG: cytochrome b/b6 domain-containing protein [Gloeomargaritaceae cyanobacterium C42_A2020_066]|nr:cytochrome b/b6 domain-containing protein [Gloeomargaritaceae cyanobacterium C42_A2020_066]